MVVSWPQPRFRASAQHSSIGSTSVVLETKPRSPEVAAGCMAADVELDQIRDETEKQGQGGDLRPLQLSSYGSYLLKNDK